MLFGTFCVIISIMEEENIIWFLEGELRDNSPWIIPIRESFTIGRLESSNLILSSGSVSRRHAMLEISDGELYVTDRNSSNGTYINGIRINSRSLLRNGDLLRFGTCEFKVIAGSPAEREKKNHTIVGATGEEQGFSERFGLSDRESDILYFLVRGFNLQEIGKKLFISPGTVKNHVLKIYKKTDCHSRIELSTLFSRFSKSS